MSGAGQAPPGDRCCLKSPIFEGDSGVEQFIIEFGDVATIAEWPEPVRIFQLRACLTGRARSFALTPDEAHIVKALRTWFGMAAQDAKVKLQGLWRDQRRALQDRANIIEISA